MYERFRDLSTHAKRSIRGAIRAERISAPEDICNLTDQEVMWRVRGEGQINGIGRKTLAEVRSVYPLNPDVLPD
jgi:hypothetical protein